MLPWAGAISGCPACPSSVATPHDRGRTGLMPPQPSPGRADLSSTERPNDTGAHMNNIFSIIGVVVVVLVILGYFGFR